MNRVLILGGTGAMGIYLVKLLSESGYWEITVTSRSKRENNIPNVTYIQGNAREFKFISELLRERYDVIVDFMNYGYDEFKDRVQLLTNSTEHYLFLSSCRVYANSAAPITEDNARLLDVSDDMDFLSTNRYALRKARQENMLMALKNKNWTIIRPYITYSDSRLQLGVYEKEQWLYRFLNGKKVVIRREILNKKTSLTCGKDVAFAISRLMLNTAAFGETVNIVTPETITWLEIYMIYRSVLERETGKTFELYTSAHFPLVENCFEGGYNTLYDRLYDRVFCSDKAEKLCGGIGYTPIKIGLGTALTEFIRSGAEFLPVQWDFEALSDRMTGDRTPIDEIFDINGKSVYIDCLNNGRFFEADNYLYGPLDLKGRLQNA